MHKASALIYLLVIVLFLSLGLVASLYFKNNFPLPLNKTHQVINNQTLEETLREKALKYLSTRPNIEDQTWEDFFNKSYLAKTSGKNLSYDWFSSHNSTIIKTDRSYVVSWLGLPDCEQDESQPGGPDTGPNFFDSKGNRCYLLWEIRVFFDENFNPVKVEISEVGGVV